VSERDVRDRDAALAALEELVVRAARRPRPLGDDAEMVEAATRAIAGSARMSPVEQLDVYREQFWARHVHSLEDDFAIARHFAGAVAFFDLVAAYFESQPPTSFDLRRLGAALPALAATRAPFAGDAMLLESMRFDWAFMEAYDAPSAPPLDPATFANATDDDWPRAKLAFDPALRPMALAWPLHETRAAIRANESPARPEPRASFIVVYRGRDSLHWFEIAPMAFELLEALRGGAELGAACEAVARAHGAEVAELGPMVATWFQEWTSRGWVTRVSF
jgi:hypothetical protein